MVDQEADVDAILFRLIIEPKPYWRIIHCEDREAAIRRAESLGLIAEPMPFGIAVTSAFFSRRMKTHAGPSSAGTSLS